MNLLKKLHLRYINRFEKVDVKLRRKQASSQFIALYPRYILEAIAILLLTNIAYNLGKGEMESNILPKLGFFSLGFIRLLPAIQQVYSRISIIKTYLSSIEALNRALHTQKEFKIIEIENTKVIDTVMKSIAIARDTRGDTVAKSPEVAAILISSSPAPIILKRKTTPSNPKTALIILTMVCIFIYFFLLFFLGY